MNILTCANQKWYHTFVFVFFHSSFEQFHMVSEYQLATLILLPESIPVTLLHISVGNKSYLSVYIASVNNRGLIPEFQPLFIFIL